jgi:hydrogenase maturation factor
MKIGKVEETVLKRSVFKQFQVKREEVIIGPGIGEDCSVIKVGPHECIVLSSDPITGSSSQMGELAVHITLNDLAASGATPIGLMLTLLLPDGYSEESLKALMKSITQLAKEYNVQIIGGHTEVTDAVIKPIVTVTGVGKIHEDKVMVSSKMKPDMDIVMTKWAGIEGTSIIANEGENQLTSYYHKDLVEEAKSFAQYLSVVKDSEIAMKYNVYAMHDVTEGGIYGALWEIGAKAGLGIIVDQSLIPIRQETIEICEYFDLDPYKLIGSGSMLIVTDESEKMVLDLESSGIKATVIGKLTEGNHRQIKFDDVMRSIGPAKSDELYKALEQCNK